VERETKKTDTTFFSLENVTEGNVTAESVLELGLKLSSPNSLLLSGNERKGIGVTFAKLLHDTVRPGERLRFFVNVTARTPDNAPEYAGHEVYEYRLYSSLLQRGDQQGFSKSGLALGLRKGLARLGFVVEALEQAERLSLIKRYFGEPQELSGREETTSPDEVAENDRSGVGFAGTLPNPEALRLEDRFVRQVSLTRMPMLGAEGLISQLLAQEGVAWLAVDFYRATGGVGVLEDLLYKTQELVGREPVGITPFSAGLSLLLSGDSLDNLNKSYAELRATLENFGADHVAEVGLFPFVNLAPFSGRKLDHLFPVKEHVGNLLPLGIPAPKTGPEATLTVNRWNALNGVSPTGNTLVVGPSGAGKSMLAKKLLTFELQRGTRVVVVGLEDEYRTLASFFGGTVVEPASQSEPPSANFLCLETTPYKNSGAGDLLSVLARVECLLEDTPTLVVLDTFYAGATEELRAFYTSLEDRETVSCILAVETLDDLRPQVEAFVKATETFYLFPFPGGGRDQHLIDLLGGEEQARVLSLLSTHRQLGFAEALRVRRRGKYKEGEVAGVALAPLNYWASTARPDEVRLRSETVQQYGGDVAKALHELSHNHTAREIHS